MTKPTRILVVDDTPAVLQIFSRILRSRGYEVIEASTGAEGLRLAQEMRPDLLVLDVVMPDISGIEVCRRIKTDPKLVDVFVILASGEALSIPERVGGLATGADDYITKPVIMDEFLARVRTMLRLRDTAAALRASEQHYKRLVEVLPDAVCLLDLEGRVVTTNHRASEMLGFVNNIDMLGMRFSNIIHPTDLERFNAGIEETLKTGIKRNSEYTAIKKEGSFFPIELSSVLSTDPDGKPSGIVTVCRDITERKRSESRIRELLHILNQAHDAICIRDLEGRIQYFNHGAERLFGWTGAEVRDQPITNLHLHDREQWTAAQEQLLQDGEWNGELTMQTKSGQSIWVHSRWTVVQGHGNQQPHILEIDTDITERKRTQQQLADALKLNQTILDNIPDPAWLKDANGCFLAGNKSLARFYRCQPQELAGKTTKDLPQGGAEWIAEDDFKVIHSGKTVVFDQVIRDGDRGTLWFEIAKSPVFNETGDVIGAVGIARDITERKWAESLLHAQRDFGVLLSSTNELKVSMERLLSIALEFEGIDCGAIFMARSGTEDLDLVANHGFSKGFIQSNHRSIPLPSTAAMQEDCISHMRLDLAREGLTAIEATPIRHANRLIALLLLGSHSAEIPLRSWKAIEAIATQAGDAMGRILAEESLRANRQMLVKTLHSLRSAVFIVDAKTGLIQDCNPSATRVFGYSREELINQGISILHVDAATERDFMMVAQEAIKAKGFSEGAEVMMKRKDGTLFPTEQSHNPIELDGKQLLGWVSVIRDITVRKQAEKEMRELPLRIIEAQESERLRVARELHDGVNQVIASAKMRMQKIAESIVSANPATKEMLARCSKMLVQALEENRRIAHNLRPSELDELGLASACRNFCEQTQLRTNLQIECSIPKIEQRVAPSIELNLFRILQEAIANIEQHAQAKSVKVALSFKGDSVTLRIQDDGCGFDPGTPKQNRRKLTGIGLTNMRERAASMGGTCELKSAPKEGTAITVHVPNASVKEV